MSIARRLIGTTDAAAYTPIYAEDVFSANLYTGNGSTQTITNGINLSGKGGLVWIKGRSDTANHSIYDTTRGATLELVPNNYNTSAQASQSTGLTSFGSTGFSIGSLAKLNTSSSTYVAWTFRKAPKFFDVVTYSGNNTPGTQILHSLGSTPAITIIKALNDDGWGWLVQSSAIGWSYGGFLSGGNQFTTGANTPTPITSVSSSSFTLGNSTKLGNVNGSTYVAYLFASDAGGFGDTGTDSVIKCGSYTGNGSTSGPTVTLGWEPQFIIIKSSSYGSWNIFDTKRGIPTGAADPYLLADSSAAEATTNGDLIDLTSTGFVIKNTSSEVNTSGTDYMYIAIRKNMNT